MSILGRSKLRNSFDTVIYTVQIDLSKAGQREQLSDPADRSGMREQQGEGWDA
jgi:hypothetical protein